MGLTRRQTKLAILGIVIAVFAGIVLWRPRTKFTPRPARVYSVLFPEPIALAPGLYLLGKNAPAAVYLIETPEGIVLIDSGLEADASVVREQIRQLGLDVQQLRAIFLTHVHADHSLGAEHLRSLTGAKVYAGQGDAEVLRSGDPREAFFSIYSMPEHATHPTTVDVTVNGGETIAFGDTRIEVFASPGHTTGSICYLLQRPGLRALFTGDVVQHLSSVSPGFLGTYTAYLPPLYRGDVRAALATLRRLRDLPLPDLILPGHPRMDLEPQDPHVPLADWQALLDTGILEMKRLLARYDADGADFLDGVAKELLPGLHYLGDYQQTPVYCLVTSKHLLLFDAPGGAALVDWLRQRWQVIGCQDRKLTAVLLTSAASAATEGLEALTSQTHCQVVGTAACLASVRGRCPKGTALVSVENLEQTGWFPGQALALGSAKDTEAAYVLKWHGKTTLVSGRVPVKLTNETAKALMTRLSSVDRGIELYRTALERLVAVKPDLWLTAIPTHGQNANLYDNEWENIVRQNQQLMNMAR